jgi:hypothetical protein
MSPDFLCLINFPTESGHNCFIFISFQPTLISVIAVLLRIFLTIRAELRMFG